MTAPFPPGPLERYPRRRRVPGNLHRWRDVELPGPDRRADILVWLPPGYRRGTDRYPVVYLHDGGNLFDPRTSFAGTTWRAGEALTALHRRGMDAIAVGIPCSPTRRIEEYSPYPHRDGEAGGDADRYVDFLTDHLKPWVDDALRTRPGREDTLVAGSSLGGVVSLHAWVRRPDVFGGVGAFSTAFWVPGAPHLQDLERALAQPHPPTRFYLDVGGRETPEDPDRQRSYVADTERVVAALRAADVPVRYTYDSAAHHHETAWAERLPAALAWLLEGYAVTPPGAPTSGLRGVTAAVLRRARRLAQPSTPR